MSAPTAAAAADSNSKIASSGTMFRKATDRRCSMATGQSLTGFTMSRPSSCPSG